MGLSDVMLCQGVASYDKSGVLCGVVSYDKAVCRMVSSCGAKIIKVNVSFQYSF